MIRLVVYELMSRQSPEGKLEDEDNGWMHKPCDRMNDRQNERKKAVNEP